MKTIDYNNYDTLKIYANKSKCDDIIYHYNLFEWEVYEKVDNARYEDTVDITFIRPHKIENKDELQLLQVYMEERLNGIAKIEKDKYSRTLAFSLSTGVIGIAFVVFSILAFLGYLLPMRNIVGVVSMTFGVVLLTLFTVFLPIFIKKDRLKCDTEIARLSREVDEISDRVSVLKGDKDGKQ